eukprot:gnl/Dysnectes_brevis/7462_a12511_452.p1 GENE.gnl/Dysnectes_brevis/7462_a12511_452~~gnl/Dysnectes_brevis/7462_a12511_452.p1  ORF type:complete len:318 (+),score=6.31 gnl/Dysnectes_brevis/7462_a12511_452:108-956(+)
MPVTSRYFITNILNSFYQDTVFHRIIEDKFVQSGLDHDLNECNAPSQPLPYESSRSLSFSQSGLLAWSNCASSQFFITIQPCPGLDGAGHTIFGRVLDTPSIFVLKRISARELKEGTVDEPRYPVKLTRISVKRQYFKDIVVSTAKVHSKISSSQKTTDERQKALKAKKVKSLRFSHSLFDNDDDDQSLSAPVSFKVIPCVPKPAQTDDTTSVVVKPALVSSSDQSLSKSKPVKKRRKKRRKSSTETDTTITTTVVPMFKRGRGRKLDIDQKALFDSIVKKD